MQLQSSNLCTNTLLSPPSEKCRNAEGDAEKFTPTNARIASHEGDFCFITRDVRLRILTEVTIERVSIRCPWLLRLSVMRIILLLRYGKSEVPINPVSQICLDYRPRW